MHLYKHLSIGSRSHSRPSNLAGGPTCTLAVAIASRFNGSTTNMTGRGPGARRSALAARREVNAHRSAVVVVDAATDEFLVDEPIADPCRGRRADVELFGQRSHRLWPSPFEQDQHPMLRDRHVFADGGQRSGCYSDERPGRAENDLADVGGSSAASSICLH